MALCAKTFEEELDLVDAASESEQGEVALRMYLLPLVESVADTYRTFYDNRIPREELIGSGWKSFDLALKTYLEQVNDDFDGEDAYKFSAYFTWFVREGVTEGLRHDLH